MNDINHNVVMRRLSAEGISAKKIKTTAVDLMVEKGEARAKRLRSAARGIERGNNPVENESSDPQVAQQQRARVAKELRDRADRVVDAAHRGEMFYKGIRQEVAAKLNISPAPWWNDAFNTVVQ